LGADEKDETDDCEAEGDKENRTMLLSVNAHTNAKTTTEQLFMR
jgi:hypothetical protein